MTTPGPRPDATGGPWPSGGPPKVACPSDPARWSAPTTVAQVAATLAACNDARVPVTAAAGRSGVCGGAIPVHGGVALDLTALNGPQRVDETSLIADVAAGTFGPDLEAALGAEGAGYTLGHWPQSMDLSTVGGWLACRGAGQYSTRYGKIEDMVIGLEVVLADGRIVHTEGKGPRAATGPNLTQLFVGSEGTLGVITEARLRIHPVPAGTGAPRLRLRHVHRRARGVPHDVAPRRDAGGPPSLRPDRVGAELRPSRHQRADRARRGRSRASSSATMGVVDAECTPGAGRARAGYRAGRAVARAPQRRLGPRAAVARRHRRRHRRGVGIMGGAARPLRGGGRRA